MNIMKILIFLRVFHLFSLYTKKKTNKQNEPISDTQTFENRMNNFLHRKTQKKHKNQNLYIFRHHYIFKQKKRKTKQNIYINYKF